jgi:hypothetical protein
MSTLLRDSRSATDHVPRIDDGLATSKHAAFLGDLTQGGQT